MSIEVFIFEKLVNVFDVVIYKNYIKIFNILYKYILPHFSFVILNKYFCKINNIIKK